MCVRIRIVLVVCIEFVVLICYYLLIFTALRAENSKMITSAANCNRFQPGGTLGSGANGVGFGLGTGLTNVEQVVAVVAQCDGWLLLPFCVIIYYELWWFEPSTSNPESTTAD